MTTLLLGVGLGLTIGFLCRWFDIPLPAPPSLVGALLVVSMTLGFLTAGRFLQMSGTTAAAQAKTDASKDTSR